MTFSFFLDFPDWKWNSLTFPWPGIFFLFSRMFSLTVATLLKHTVGSEITVNSEIFARVFVCFVWFDSLCPINNLSVKQGRVYLGWTSTKLGLMCFAQGPQRSDAGDAQTRGPLGLESSTLPLSQCAPIARVLFSWNFTYAKFHENITLAKGWNHSVVYWYR